MLIFRGLITAHDTPRYDKLVHAISFNCAHRRHVVIHQQTQKNAVSRKYSVHPIAVVAVCENIYTKIFYDIIMKI